jgi:acetyltransferase-like isoleucine patch superfamily enzyme
MLKKDKTKTFETTQFHKEIRCGKLIKTPSTIIRYSASLDLTGDIIIGKYSEISHEVRIFTHKHKWNHSKERRAKIQKVIPVNLIIGEDVFIGVGTIIIGVESIGDGAVIGAGSVLTKNVPSYEIWAGNPAKKIGIRGE